MKKIQFPLIAVLILLLTSCYSSYLTTEKQNSQKTIQSKFASGESIGMKKEDIIKTFGLPTSTSIEQQKDGKSENLYYIEIIDNIQIVTVLAIKNGITISQKVDQITSNYDDRFKKLEKDLKILQTPRLYN
ncbi:MAG: hypothetical protein LBJ04_17975 [Sphingobacterium sp.]|jgi:hypothetical protein|nr:hypothetical protein [Sphingobacterium sp.]